MSSLTLKIIIVDDMWLVCFGKEESSFQIKRNAGFNFTFYCDVISYTLSYIVLINSSSNTFEICFMATYVVTLLKICDWSDSNAEFYWNEVQKAKTSGAKNIKRLHSFKILQMWLVTCKCESCKDDGIKLAFATCKRSHKFW